MFYKVNVGVSHHHVHLTEDTYNKLFDEPLTKDKDLKQIGQFASNQYVDILVNDKIIEHVRIVGPFRKYNQVEITYGDTYKLKVYPPVRKSGDLKDALDVTLRTSKASINVNNALIIADRHIHMNKEDATKYNVLDNDKVKLHFTGVKRGILEASIKVSDDGYFECHLDDDDANAFMIKTGDEIVFEINK